jgi:hypothetical protein
MNSGKPEQEFQRSRNRSSSEAGTGVPAKPEQEFQRSRNRSSSEIAGISSYDGNGSTIYLSFIDNILSVLWN